MNAIIRKINFEKTYYYLIMLFAFTMPLSRASISLLVILLPITWLIEGDFKQKFKVIQNNQTLLSFLIFILVTILSLLWTQNHEDAGRPLRMLLYLATIFVIATSLKREYVNNVISAFLAGMFISEFIAYGVFFEIWQFKHATPQNPSPFMFHIDYSVFMAFTSILLLHRILSKRYKLKEKLIFGVFFVTVTGNLFLAAGRTGQVALIAAIIVMSIIHFRLSIKSILISLLLIIAIYTTAYNVSNTFELRAHQAMSDVKKVLNADFNSSWGIRAAFWMTTLNILKEHPFGVGVGDYIDATKAEVQKQKYNNLLSNESKLFISDNHPHNQYLLIFLQSGFIGLLSFLYFIYKFLTLKIDNQELKELSILFMTIFLVSFLAEPLFLKQFTIALFGLFVGLFVNYNIQSLNETQ